MRLWPISHPSRYEQPPKCMQMWRLGKGQAGKSEKQQSKKHRHLPPLFLRVLHTFFHSHTQRPKCAGILPFTFPTFYSSASARPALKILVLVIQSAEGFDKDGTCHPTKNLAIPLASGPGSAQHRLDGFSVSMEADARHMRIHKRMSPAASHADVLPASMAPAANNSSMPAFTSNPPAWTRSSVGSASAVPASLRHSRCSASPPCFARLHFSIGKGTGQPLWRLYTFDFDFASLLNHFCLSTFPENANFVCTKAI